MGKRTDAYSTAVTQYATDSSPHKTAIANADIEIAKIWQTYGPIEQTANRTGITAPLVAVQRDLADAKKQKHDAMVELNRLVSAFSKTTNEFEAAMKKKKSSINPFKSKTSLPTAEATILHAKRTIAADRLLIKL